MRARLTVLYGVLFLVAGAVSLTAIYLVVQQRLDEQLNNGDTSSRMATLREEATRSGDNDLTITQPDGTQIPFDELVEETRAEQKAIKDAALDSLVTQGSLAVLGVGLVAAAAGWIVAGRGLRPLHAITATAQRIAGSRGAERDLAERIALTGSRNDDVKRLADSFDAMLDALDHAFDGQRRFVANASHELRTPLALERGLIELEITRPTATPDSVHFGKALLEINERHARLIDGMLFLADSENKIENPVPVELSDIAAHVTATIGATVGERGITAETALAEAPVTGDPLLLEQLTRNLIENALQHNTAGGWIRVATRTENGHALLDVSNTGPVVPDFEIDGLFEPFRRHHPDRTHARKGFGLGLSIVRAIATTHGGTIAARARAGGGLDVTARLPGRAAWLEI